MLLSLVECNREKKKPQVAPKSVKNIRPSNVRIASINRI